MFVQKLKAFMIKIKRRLKSLYCHLNVEILAFVLSAQKNHIILWLNNFSKVRKEFKVEKNWFNTFKKEMKESPCTKSFKINFNLLMMITSIVYIREVINSLLIRLQELVKLKNLKIYSILPKIKILWWLKWFFLTFLNKNSHLIIQ